MELTFQEFLGGRGGVASSSDEAFLFLGQAVDLAVANLVTRSEWEAERGGLTEDVEVKGMGRVA